jgi:hypothetical protein
MYPERINQLRSNGYRLLDIRKTQASGGERLMIRISAAKFLYPGELFRLDGCAPTFDPTLRRHV